MAEPVLVRAYNARSPEVSPRSRKPTTNPSQTLPPVAAFAFNDVLRCADSPDFQRAIDGIAEIYSKSRLSLADEYAAHLPPLGEITAADSRGLRPDVLRPGARTALSSVPEGGSGSSEGSRKSRRRVRIPGLSVYGRAKEPQTPRRKIQIGCAGRSIIATCTTAMAPDLKASVELEAASGTVLIQPQGTSAEPQRSTSVATQSLKRLLTTRDSVDLT
nr:hypothetical protein CFP56_58781 [Quercus suber]